MIKEEIIEELFPLLGLPKSEKIFDLHSTILNLSDSIKDSIDKNLVNWRISFELDKLSHDAQDIINDLFLRYNFTFQNQRVP